MVGPSAQDESFLDSVLSQKDAQVIRGCGQVGIGIQRGAQNQLGLPLSTLLAQQKPKVEIGDRIFWLELERLA